MAFEKGIYFKMFLFSMKGTPIAVCFKNINFFIPDGKVTAIVGASGRKTTLIKMLLKFYEPVDGEIFF